MTYTGIDLHKSFCFFSTVDQSGNVVRQGKIKNEHYQILNYFADLPDQTKAVIECTIGWYWLTDLLHEHGINIILANTRMLKAIASAKVKTDKLDANVMAQLLRMDFIPQV